MLSLQKNVGRQTVIPQDHPGMRVRQTIGQSTPECAPSGLNSFKNISIIFTLIRYRICGHQSNSKCSCLSCQCASRLAQVLKNQNRFCTVLKENIRIHSMKRKGGTVETNCWNRACNKTAFVLVKITQVLPLHPTLVITEFCFVPLFMSLNGPKRKISHGPQGTVTLV